MGSSGLEPPTSRLSGARSNQLSYEPVCPAILIHSGEFAQRILVVRLVFFPTLLTVMPDRMEMMGIEPMTPCLQGRCSPS